MGSQKGATFDSPTNAERRSRNTKIDGEIVEIIDGSEGCSMRYLCDALGYPPIDARFGELAVTIKNRLAYLRKKGIVSREGRVWRMAER